jgi:excisionase family DNA binding protein
MSNQQSQGPSKLLSINEASSYLSLKVSKLRSMVFKREIPMVKIGRLVRFNKLELDQWIEQLSRN